VVAAWSGAVAERDAEIAKLSYIYMWSHGVAKALLTTLLSDNGHTFKSVHAQRAHVDGFLRGKPAALVV
jgi:hypothetical protein